MDNLSLDYNSLDETLERWFLQLEFFGAFKENPAETVPVSDSLNRITARPVFAALSSPSFYAASCDGVAVESSKTFTANTINPLKLRIGTDARFVDTGSIMPEGFDAVAPIERVKFLPMDFIEITHFCAPWDNVRPIGEEINAREIIIPAHHKIRPLDIAAMYSGGVSSLEVIKKPGIGILPIGAGLVPAGAKPSSGKVIETSSQIISQSLKTLGCEPVIFDIVPESLNEIIKACIEAVQKVDMLVVIGGKAHGTRPVAEVIKRMGEIITYGVLLKPGMSSCFGIIDKVPVIGVPGYPLSTLIIFEMFGLPLIYKKLGVEPVRKKTIRAYMAQRVTSASDIDEFLRVSLADVGGMPVAVPISRGAHILMSLVRSDGIVRMGKDTLEINTGESVDVELLQRGVNLNKKAIIAGTYDMCFDILRNHLQVNYPEFSLFSSNMGSIRGLMSLKAGYAHIASIHIFDDESGEYNIPFVQKLLYDVPLILVNIFHRKLGFIVARGNPKEIKDFSDLTRSDVKTINRIRGSGTRMVFDYYLKKNHIDINRVKGYTDEAHTHLNLAAAVASGNVDVGLGILEAAKAANVDFIPVVPEKLDFVIPKRFLTENAVRCLLATVASDAFVKEVSELGGYDTSHTGKVSFEI